MDGLSPAMIVGIGGLVLGAIFGATAQLTNFCTMGAISDRVVMGDGRRLRAWVLATAVAMIGAQLLDYSRVVDLKQSVYLTTSLGWLGAILGGLVFGFGMVLTGGCPSRTLVRLGAGNLKSLVVSLVLGVVAYMTMRGLIAPARIAFEDVFNLDLATRGLTSQNVGEIAAAAFGAGGEWPRVAVAVVVSAALLLFCFKDASFRQSPRNLIAGIVIGLTVVAGWFVTGVLAHDDFEPVQLASVTLTGPTGDALVYLMTFTGATIDFGIAVVGGIIIGSFLSALLSGGFRIESFVDRNDLVRHLTGAAMMGIGGVFALGCTVGQGITGMSTLAFGSILAWLSIMGGGYVGIKYLEEGSFSGAIRASLARS